MKVSFSILIIVNKAGKIHCLVIMLYRNFGIHIKKILSSSGKEPQHYATAALYNVTDELKLKFHFPSFTSHISQCYT